MRKSPPLSVIFAAIWLALGCISGIFAMFELDLLSIPGIFFLALYALTAYTLYALFYDRNVGRLLAAVQLLLFGLFGALVSAFLSMGSAPVPILVVYILIAMFQLTVAWHLFVGSPAKEYANAVTE